MEKYGWKYDFWKMRRGYKGKCFIGVESREGEKGNIKIKFRFFEYKMEVVDKK